MTTFEFLDTIFQPDDLILFRPIETWEEQGKRHSRTIWKHTRYDRLGLQDPTSAVWRSHERIITPTLQRLQAAAEKERAGLCFGCCPRLGGDGKYDMAFHIRQVNFLWCDLDDCRPDGVGERVHGVVPVPTIVVDSGNGVHLYWKLQKPVVFDGPAPLPVHKDFQGKVPVSYVKHDGERYDVRHHSNLPDCCRMFPAALEVQDILAGIAEAVGGDTSSDF